MNIFLTGVTGLVGSSVFYEVLRLYAQGGLAGKIYVLVRKKTTNIMDRINDLLDDKNTPDFIKEYSRDDLLSWVESIEGDVTDKDLRDKVSHKISKSQELYVIHCAASTNLYSSKEAEQKIIRNNYQGTQNLLEACAGYDMKFVFISTIASLGVWSKGIISNEYIHRQNNEFRNPYEKYKFLTEKMIHEYCSERLLKYQILRPSAICGRLIDSPLYFTSKFDMFYGCAKFFFNLSRWKLSNDTVRLHVNKSASLNIISVDYIAKTIVRVFLKDIPELNIVHSVSMPHVDYIPRFLDAVGYLNYEIVEVEPLNFNKTESLYNGLIGSVFTPYLLAEPIEFDTALLREVMSDIEEPDVRNNLENIMLFAVNEWSK